MTNDKTSLTLPNGVTLNYGYDAASQLTGINYALGSNTLGNLTYAYDLEGRRTGVGGSHARTGTPQAASAASYNVNNQLTQWKGASLAYDANGNLTSDGTNTYTWNARNQLVTISGGASASFQYDPFGRRVSKTIGGMTQYLYDGANPVQELSGTSNQGNQGDRRGNQGDRRDVSWIFLSHRNHSTAPITIQPSISTIRCKTLNTLISSCYPFM